MKRNRAFTLIELLTVIAIIAILAAIITPVIVRAKDSAYRSSDISKMNDVRAALQLYKADQGEYPPTLLGYVSTYSGNPMTADVIPANLLNNNYLYSKRLPALDSFRPAFNRTAVDVTTTAVWPRQPAGGPGIINQRFTTTDAVVRPSFWTGSCVTVNARFYKISGFDVAEVPTQPNRTELRYTLFWSELSTPADPCNIQPNERGSAIDDPRQLGYAEPPETTVVTWNSFFREWTIEAGNRVPIRNKRDIVLFLGGAARPMDSRAVYDLNWRMRP